MIKHNLCRGMKRTHLLVNEILAKLDENKSIMGKKWIVQTRAEMLQTNFQFLMASAGHASPLRDI